MAIRELIVVQVVSRAFSQVLSVGKAVKQWILPDIEEFPEDAAGELMQRYMQRATWFDKMSMWWFKRPFLQKLAYIAVATLAVSLFSLTVGAIFGVALLVGHKLLISHTQHRYATARIFARETIELNASLRESQALLQQTTEQLAQATQTISAQGVELATQASALVARNAEITQLNTRLTTAVGGVESAANAFVAHEEATTLVLQSVTSNLARCDADIIQSAEQAAALGGSIAALTSTIQATTADTRSCALAIQSFERFISTKTSRVLAEAAEVSKSANNLLTELQAGHEDEAAYMEQLSAQMQAKGIFIQA